MKYTLITSASSGIGYEVALKFSTEGKNLILCTRRLDKLIELKKIGNKVDVIIIDTDLSILENIYQFYNSLAKYHIETFINNAGFGDFSSIKDLNLNKYQEMLNLNIQTSNLKYHTAQEMANFLHKLYSSDAILGFVDNTDYTFHLSNGKVPLKVSEFKI